MANNFDVHSWKRNQLIESTLDDANLKAKQNVDTVYNQILKDFSDKFESPIEKSLLKFSIASAFTELSLMKEEKSEDKSYLESLSKSLKQNHPELNFYVSDYADRIDVKGSQRDMFNWGDKNQGKKFGEYEVFHIDDDDRGEIVRIVKSDSISKNFENLNPLKETLKFIMENPEGYSNYFPGGKTKGLDKKTLSTILMQIAKDIEDDGKQLDESNLCKRGRNYMAARKRAGEKSSAYLSGRAVKVCKGQIKGSDSKKKKSY